ncbi:MAG TPA: hypothetical protein V6C58_18640 [Allocoleopsis sp.]
MDELKPVIQELTQHPVAFLGGFASGLFRLNLSDDPVKTWLGKQGTTGYTPNINNNSSKSSGPQTISID